MSKKISRREMLGIGAATIAGAALVKTDATAINHGGSGAAYQPFRGYNPRRGGDRPFWEKSYSGGPVDVKPLAPVLPGKGYKPVVVPNGKTLPFKIVDGAKVCHLISEEVDHAFDSGLRAGGRKAAQSTQRGKGKKNSSDLFQFFSYSSLDWRRYEGEGYAKSGNNRRIAEEKIVTTELPYPSERPRRMLLAVIIVLAQEPMKPWGDSVRRSIGREERS